MNVRLTLPVSLTSRQAPLELELSFTTINQQPPGWKQSVVISVQANRSVLMTTISVYGLPILVWNASAYLLSRFREAS